jgi:UDP-2,3-diacylglucosamine hydrolase
VLTVFVSDLHLSEQAMGIRKLFEGFLNGPARDADQLYILGDLFDYWLGDDSLALPFERSIADQLAAAACAGTTIHFMPGNRDFLAGRKLMAAARMHALADSTACEINGRPTLLLHGDTLCTDDTAYWAFRNSVRSADWQRNFLDQPLDVRRQQVEALRNRSESAKQEKSEALMNVNAAAVATAFRQHRVGRMIHGHVHRQGVHEHEIDGVTCRRWVLGDWGRTGSYLRCDDDDWRLYSYPK